MQKLAKKGDVFGRNDCDEKDFQDEGVSRKAKRAQVKAEQLQAKAKEIISLDHLPSSTKRLRACLTCKLILNASRWKELGKCPNCPRSGGISDTTENFQNVIGQIYPRMSWVSQYQGMADFIPGLYAMAIDINAAGGWSRGDDLDDDSGMEDVV